MRKLLLIAFVTGSVLITNNASAKHADTAEVAVKIKLEQVEKIVKELQAEVKTLKATNTTLAAEIATIKETIPATKVKKLVIDRRGSKQAYFK